VRRERIPLGEDTQKAREAKDDLTQQEHRNTGRNSKKVTISGS